MKIYKWPLVALIAIAVSTTGCKDDEEEVEEVKVTTVAEDKVDIDTDVDAIAVTVEDMKSVEMVQVMEDFAMDDSEDAEYFRDTLFASLENVLDVESFEDASPSFDFASNKGKYTWNATSESWNESNSSSLIFEFPSDHNQNSNNVVLTISNYTDALVDIDGESIHMPVTVDITLVIDGVKQVEFNLNDLNLVSNNYALDFGLFVNPYVFTADVSQSTTAVSTSFTFSDNGNNNFALNFDAVGDFDIEGGDLEVESFVGDVSHEDMKVTADVDVVGIDALNDNGSAAEYNALFSIDIYHKNIDIADVLLEDDGTDVVPMIVYIDGTKEELEPKLEEIEDKLEAAFADFD
ncbi:MAG: hypothetical protein HRT72_06125 [Flavobacteriales bacterium]|nr:hypothetical protein [Flavobacteriales bacterium]